MGRAGDRALLSVDGQLQRRAALLHGRAAGRARIVGERRPSALLALRRPPRDARFARVPWELARAPGVDGTLLAPA